MVHVADAEVDPGGCTLAYQPARTSKLPRGPEHRRVAGAVVDGNALAAVVDEEEARVVAAKVLEVDAPVVSESPHADTATIITTIGKTAMRVDLITADVTEARPRRLSCCTS